MISIVKEHSRNEALEKNMIISEMLSNKISIYLQGAVKTIETAANFSMQSFNEEDKIMEELFRIYDNYDYFDLIFYMDINGKLIFSKPSRETAYEESYIDRDYYQDIMKNKKPYISRLYISRVLGQPHFVVASPVLDDDDNILGLIAAGIPLTNIKSIIQENENGFEGNMQVLDNYGALITSTEVKNDNKVEVVENCKITMDNDELFLFDVIRDTREGIGEIYKNGELKYSAITYVDYTNWMVMIEQSESMIFKDVFKVIDRLRFIILITILVGLVVGLVLANMITMPIEKLVEKVRKMNYDKNSPELFEEISNDEIGELNTAFKEMTINLDDKVLQLKESYIREKRLQQYLNNILMSAGNGILVIDKDNIITIFNNALEKITGYKKEIFINKNYEELSNVIKIDFRSIINKTIEKGEIIYDVEQKLLKNNNHSIFCSVNISAIKDENENFVGVVLLLKDIDKEKSYEEELKREDRINILGEFSTSIIHDIGNPLAGLSNLLELYDNESTTEGEKESIFTLIESEISDLNEIVINYLNFSRKNEINNSFVDLRTLIDETINILKIELINNNISIKKKYLYNHSYVNINRRSMKQALINIIKNAIQAIDMNGCIFIELREKGNDIELVIRDTGIGINEIDIQNIFEPFYTTKINGNGLGLSIAYKIIRENEGQIEVKSQIGKGTEFIICFPNIESRSVEI
jgi:PAS domain S-box-containing protein